MQTYPHTPPAAQHLPAGWPLPEPATAHQPRPENPVIGGGAAAWDTTTRVRWGRVLAVVIGIALAGFSVWHFTTSPPSSSTGSSTGSGSRAAGGGLAPSAGLSDLDESRAARLPSAPKVPATAAPSTVDRVPATPRRLRPAARHSAAATTSGGVARRVSGVAGARPATAGRRAVGNGVSTTTTRGGGAGSNAAALPYTGAETWIAATLGLLMLAGGVLLQVHAVRIGMMAMLYRRGILLRPVDCARLAGERGMPTVRVWVSGVLHRLLAEPLRSDFVSVH